MYKFYLTEILNSDTIKPCPKNQEIEDVCFLALNHNQDYLSGYLSIKCCWLLGNITLTGFYPTFKLDCMEIPDEY